METNKGDLRAPSLTPPSQLPEAAGGKGAPGGWFDLPNLALLERLLNSGPTGIGFGLIFLSITAVNLDKFLGYGLAVGGFIFVSLSSLPRLIAELPSITRKQPPDDTMHAKRLPRKLLFGLAITLTAGTFFLYSEATAPAVNELTRIIGHPFDHCPIDMPLEQYLKCKQIRE